MVLAERLYQLSHASTSRFFSRDFYLVNSSGAKNSAFNETSYVDAEFVAQFALARLALLGMCLVSRLLCLIVISRQINNPREPF